MKLSLILLVILPIIVVLAKKNGHAVDSKNQAGECLFNNYCNNTCIQVYRAEKGYCCLLKCYCFGLDDNKKVLDIWDSTKKYCDVQIIG
uniref:Sodium channel toxin meuNa9 n=1 Tax=Mesobuthus eupeus TaxID=34648 RepID=A0A146CIT2_MESEU|nr:sodium channel toxin meuNa9 [Mesobuthus eupeus]